MKELKTNFGVDWHAQPYWFKCGTLLKKDSYMKEAINPLTNLPTIVERARIVVANHILQDFTDENVEALVSKTLHNCPPGTIVVDENYNNSGFNPCTTY